MSRTLIVVAAIAGAAWLFSANSSRAEEEWPLSLELIWETPEKGEPVFAEGFPPPEIKAAFEDTSIPEEDKEWVLNNIRVWAAYRTKKLWLDSGEAVALPVVSVTDRELHLFPSRNKKYWLVRAMRFEGPEIPPKPSFHVSPETARDPDYWEQVNAWERAVSLQKAHWREAFMDVEGRAYWEKEFGPYDTHLENSYLGNVEAYVSDDGRTVVKRGGSKYSTFCDRAGNCILAEATASFSSYAQLSSDGSRLVILHAGHRSRVSGGFSPPVSCVAGYDRSGREVWRGEWVDGDAEFPVVISVAEGGNATVFSVIPQISGIASDWTAYLLGPTGDTIGAYTIPGEPPRGVAFCKSNSVVVLVFDRTVQAVDAATGGELWRYNAGGQWQGSFRGISGTEELAVVSGCGDRRCTPSKGELLIFNTDGRLLYYERRGKAQASPSPGGGLLLEKAGGLKFSRLVVEE